MESSRGRAGEADLPGPRGIRFGADDLRPVRRLTAAWAAAAGLEAGRAGDFVIAVHEVAANAVRYGSPTARLLLLTAGGTVQAEIRDSGRWQPADAAPDGGRNGGRGLALARRICDVVEIRSGPGGTTVLLRMSLLGAAPRGAVAGPGPGGGAARLAAGRDGA